MPIFNEVKLSLFAKRRGIYFAFFPVLFPFIIYLYYLREIKQQLENNR